MAEMQPQDNGTDRKDDPRGVPTMTQPRDTGTKIITIQTPEGEQIKTDPTGTRKVTVAVPPTKNPMTPVPSPTSY